MWTSKGVGRKFSRGTTEKRPKNSKKRPKNSSLLRIYLLHLYHVWKSRRGPLPPAADAHESSNVSTIKISIQQEDYNEGIWDSRMRLDVFGDARFWFCTNRINFKNKIFARGSGCTGVKLGDYITLVKAVKALPHTCLAELTVYSQPSINAFLGKGKIFFV